MSSVRDSVRARGGLAATYQLHQDGHSRHAIAAAVSERSVVRIRQGWFALAGLSPQLARAARVGGRLTCVSSLAIAGFWTLPSEITHIAVPHNGCRLRQPDDMRARLAEHDGVRSVRIHWNDEPDDGTAFLADPLAALRQVMSCEQPDIASAVADSVLNGRPDLKRNWSRLVPTLTQEQQRWTHHIDGVCESGIETIFWFRMRGHRIRIRRQVRVRGVGRVDFVIGDRLAIEVDGAAYHTDSQRFEADRRRDAELSTLGYRVLRFSYWQVIERWVEVESAVLAAVIRGDHHAS